MFSDDFLYHRSYFNPVMKSQNSRESLESFRLQRMMQDSILKVEKENMEIIQNGLHIQKSRKICNFPKVKSVNTNKSRLCSAKKTIKNSPLKPENQEKNSHIPENQEKDSHKPDNQEFNAKAPNAVSTICFLSHFESSLQKSKFCKLISKKNEGKELYFPCAVPLGTGFNRERPSDEPVKKPHPLRRTETKFRNNAFHHIYSKEKTKKLTVEHLPRITISGLDPSLQKKFLPEQVHKKILPQRIIKSNIIPRNSFHCVGTENSSSKDSYTQTNGENVQIHSLNSSFHDGPSIVKQNNEAIIKEIVKTTLKNIEEVACQQYHQLNERVVATKDSSTDPLKEDELICNYNPIIRATSFDSKEPKAYLQSNGTQTQPVDFKERIEPIYMEQLKNLITDSLENFQQSISYRCSSERTSSTEKVHKDVQTASESGTRSCGAVNSASTSVQVSLSRIDSRPVLKDATTQLNNSFQSTVPFEKPKDEHLCTNEHHQPINEDALYSRLETILNNIYERFRSEKREGDCRSPSPKPSITPVVHTRDVSVQFNPVTRECRSTNTWKTELVHSASQYDARVSEIRGCIQSYPPQPLKLTADACTQAGRLVRPDLDPSQEPSCQPDSSFWDEELSEGEVPLPWNLRLLSLVDQFATGVSFNASDVTDVSENEKDLSLSEGEIHPMYLRHNKSHFEISNGTTESSCNSLRRSPGEVRPFFRQRFISIDRRWSQ